VDASCSTLLVVMEMSIGARVLRKEALFRNSNGAFTVTVPRKTMKIQRRYFPRGRRDGQLITMVRAEASGVLTSEDNRNSAPPGPTA
jgi:hypothetical protein